MKQKGLAPLVVIILIALAVSGVLLYQKQTKPVSISQPSPSPVIRPVASSSAETSNWKTYINTKFNYSLKYPTDFQVEEKNDQFTASLDNKVFNISILVKDSSDKNNKYGTYLWAKSVINTLDNVSDNTDTSIGIKIRKVLISGISAIEYKLTKKHANEEVSIPALNLVFIKDGKSYLITGIADDYSEKIVDPQFINIFNQILSTFKFLDQNQKSENNLADLISFNLPKGWTQKEGNMPIVRVIYGNSSDYVDNGAGYPKVGVAYSIGRNSFTPGKNLDADIEKVKKDFPNTMDFGKMMIGGYNGYSYRWSNEIRREYLIRKGSDNWYLTFTIGSNTSNAQVASYERQIDSIINSIKFK